MNLTPIRLLVCGLVVALAAQLALAAGPAVGQEAPANAAQIERLIATLEDDAARQRLIADLRVLLAVDQRKPAVDDSAAEFVGVISGGLVELGAELDRTFRGIGDPSRLIDRLVAEAGDPERRAIWWRALLSLAVLIAGGLVAAGVARWLLRRPRRRLERQVPPSWWMRPPLLAARTLLDIVPIAAFGLAAYGVLIVAAPNQTARLVLITAIIAVVVARGAIAVARMMLTPIAADLRLFALADRTAAYLFIWSSRLINLTVYGYFVGQAGLQLGLPGGAYTLYVKLFSLILLLVVVVVVLQSRRAVTARIAGLGGDRLTPRGLRVLRDRVAEIWHILAMLYLAGVYLVWAFGVEGGFAYMAQGAIATILIIAITRVVLDLANRLVGRLFRVSDEIRERYPFIEQRSLRYLPLLRRIVAWAIELVALFLILQAWRLDVLGWFGSELGRDLIGRLVTIGAILAVSLVIWELASGLINVYLDRKDESGEQLVRSARLRTLLPLIRSALLVVITLMAAMVTLSELGVDIGPLLAGAGVAGLAIGFGAQTLVKDFITGMFILFEDSIHVGDVATVGGKTGVIEALTVRTVQLRDLSGTVHTVPFSSVDVIANLTKDFSYALLDVGIGYREDVDHVIEVLREIGAELAADPEFGANIIDELEVLGLNEFADSAVIVRVRLKTKPLTQWGIKREFNRRLKRRFDELEIEIPFPHQTIYFGADRDGKAPPMFVRMQPAAAGAPMSDAPTPTTEPAAEPTPAAPPDGPPSKRTPEVDHDDVG